MEVQLSVPVSLEMVVDGIKSATKRKSTGVIGGGGGGGGEEGVLETQSHNQGGGPFPPREQRQPLPLNSTQSKREIPEESYQ